MAKSMVPPAARVPEIQPARELWRLYCPEKAEFRFKAKTKAEATAWQKKVRAALAEAVSFHDTPKVKPAPKLLERVDKGDYVREKILVRTAPDVLMPVYILIPKEGRRPLPVVLAFNGHGPAGVKDILGMNADGSERAHGEGYQKDFGVELCRHGFMVAAPEIACFGERQTSFAYLDRIGVNWSNFSTCTQSAMLAFWHGKSLVGMRTRDGMRLVDYLATRKEADISRLGAMGISGGGMHTFFSTCLDTRIKACVVSGYYCSFRDSILAMYHCACNFTPGLARFGEMHDLAGLIAPRPMLVEAGDQDKIFPLDAVKEAVAQGKKHYAVFGEKPGIETDFFTGGHSVSGKRAYAFLAEKLG